MTEGKPKYGAVATQFSLFSNAQSMMQGVARLVACARIAVSHKNVRLTSPSEAYSIVPGNNAMRTCFTSDAKLAL